MKFAIVVFPGSNCDHDAYYAVKHVLGQGAEFVWHKESDLARRRRGGAAGRLLARRLPADGRHRPVLADHGRRSPRFAAEGGPVLGICNGFQILLEAGLLPGAMLRNRGLKFRCEFVHVRVEQTTRRSRVSARPGSRAAHADRARRGQLLRGAGRAPSLEANRQVVFRYVDAAGERGGGGQSQRLAERHRRDLQRRAQRRGPDAASGAGLRGGASGSADGLVVFRSVVEALRAGTPAADPRLGPVAGHQGARRSTGGPTLSRFGHPPGEV